MTTRSIRRAAATAVATAIGLSIAAGAALAATTDTEAATWQLRAQVRIRPGGGLSDPRSISGAVDLFHQGACRRADDLLADGEPKATRVELTLWRQAGPIDETRAPVPDVRCEHALERESGFDASARLTYPRAGGDAQRTSTIPVERAVEMAVEMANAIAPHVLETGEQAWLKIRLGSQEKRVRPMIRSLAVRHGVDVGTALRVAECESGFNPRAYSPPYAGIYQQHVGYWDRRARHFGHPGESPFDPFANVDVSLRMVKALGWGHWGCA